MLGKEFIKDVEETCTKSLVNIGMKKRRTGILTLTINDDFIGWIGLNTATRRSDTVMYINPVIGIRCQSIERIIAEIDRDKNHPYIPPTISTNVGYLMENNEYKEFDFHKDKKIKPVAEELAKTVKEYGLTFMKNNASMDKMIELIPSYAIWEDIGERLLAAYHLTKKDQKEIDAFIQKRIADGKRDDSFWERFEEFSNNYKKKFVSGQ